MAKLMQLCKNTLVHQDADRPENRTERGLRERKKRATREAIVAAATELFPTKGMRDTTIADLAAGADIAPRTFFLHFATKEDVLFHHVEDYTQTALTMMAELEPDSTPWDGVQRAVAALIDLFDDSSQHTDALAPLRARIIHEGRELPPSLVLRLAAFQQQVRDRLCARFPEAAGELIAAQLGSAVGAVSAAATYLLIDESSQDSKHVKETMQLALAKAGEGFRGSTDN